MQLDGASSSPAFPASEPLPGKSNYFIGNDPSNGVATFRSLRAWNTSAFIRASTSFTTAIRRQLEYDFRVAPGAEPSQIALSFQGASARILGNASVTGDLVPSTADGDVRFHAPHVYQPAVSGIAEQPSAEAEKTIAGSFRLARGQQNRLYHRRLRSQPRTRH